MKRYLLVSLIIAMLIPAHDSFSQFNKGRFMAGGSVRFSASNSEDTFSSGTTTLKSSSFSLAPNIGYFVIDKLAVGASVGLSTGKTTYEASGTKTTSVSTSIGPFVRYYLPVPVFFQATTLFGITKFKSVTTTSGESESTSGVAQLGLAAGYAWLLNDFVALEPMLGYQTNYNKVEGATEFEGKQGTFYLSCAFTIYLGERK